MLVDNAHKILDIYAYFKAQPGHRLISNHILAIGERRRWEVQDLQEGVEQAHQNGWIERAAEGGWLLTRKGFEEIASAVQA